MPLGHLKCIIIHFGGVFCIDLFEHNYFFAEATINIDNKTFKPVTVTPLASEGAFCLLKAFSDCCVIALRNQPGLCRLSTSSCEASYSVSQKVKACKFSQIHRLLFLQTSGGLFFLGLFLFPLLLFVYFSAVFQTWELKCFCHTKIESWERWFTPVTEECKGDIFIQTAMKWM